jgi:peptidyl-prolyl cis-trans isomerase D
MATLERIRRRSGLLIIVIGVAMLGFILTDLLGSGNSIFRGDANVVGKVNSRTYELSEFTSRLEKAEENMRRNNPQQAQFITRKQMADGVWDEMLRDQLLGAQYERLGIQVTKAELKERVIANPSIQQAAAFKDQVTGQFSEGLLSQYITNIEDNRDIDEQAAEAYSQWVEFEKGVRAQTLQTKYNQAISKGIYFPKALAREVAVGQSTQTNVNFIVKEYSSIADSLVEVTDRDFQAYYKENQEDFKSDKLADIQYVSFSIEASEADRQAVKEELESYLKPEFIETKNGVDSVPSFGEAKEDSLFAGSRSDLPVQPNYYKKNALPAGLDSTLFDQEIGYVAGPYETSGYFRLSKIVDRKMIPDSARARHILLSFREMENGNPDRSFEETRVLADSLTELLKADTSQFASLARQLSDDPGSAAKGGDLGWFDEKTMVRPFSNFVFRNEVGDIALVPSQFGYHIIEILGHRGGESALKLIDISREIIPSDETLDRIYGEASSFASQVNSAEDFGQVAEDKGYQPRPVTGLKPFDENVIGIGNNREIVGWAHKDETEVGDIQLFSNGTASYVVVILTDASEEGYRPLEDVKERILPQVINSKKADQFMDEFRTAAEGKSTIQEIADALGLAVNSQNLNFNSSVISGYGNEPKVIGTLTGLEVNQLSQPIEGERGVYLLQAFGRTEGNEPADLASQQDQQTNLLKSRVNTEVFESLKEAAKITDNRYKFY